MSGLLPSAADKRGDTGGGDGVIGPAVGDRSQPRFSNGRGCSWQQVPLPESARGPVSRLLRHRTLLADVPRVCPEGPGAPAGVAVHACVDVAVVVVRVVDTPCAPAPLSGRPSTLTHVFLCDESGGMAVVDVWSSLSALGLTLKPGTVVCIQDLRYAFAPATWAQCVVLALRCCVNDEGTVCVLAVCKCCLCVSDGSGKQREEGVGVARVCFCDYDGVHPPPPHTHRYSTFDRGLGLPMFKWGDRSVVAGAGCVHLTKARASVTQWMASQEGSSHIQVPWSPVSHVYPVCLTFVGRGGHAHMQLTTKHVTHLYRISPKVPHAALVRVLVLADVDCWATCCHRLCNAAWPASCKEATSPARRWPRWCHGHLPPPLPRPPAGSLPPLPPQVPPPVRPSLSPVVPPDSLWRP